MFPLIVGALMLWGYRRMRASRAAAPAGAPVSWPQLPAPMFSPGQHYFFAIPFPKLPSASAAETVLSLLFDGLRLFELGTGMRSPPSPVPAAWVAAYKSGQLVGFGKWSGQSVGPLTPALLSALGADPHLGASVWDSLETHITANMTAPV